MTKQNQQKLDKKLETIRKCYSAFRATSVHDRRNLLYGIAEALEADEKKIVRLASQEAHFTQERAEAEFKRTCWQLRSYADDAITGQWMDIRIDKQIAGDDIYTTDLRKMNIGIGTVLVFGAGNFPLAYSTAGGDTASALLAGCPVIVKAHPAHEKTSIAVAKAIAKAVKAAGFPMAVFTHIIADNATTEYLVKHPTIAAVGFTGSFAGGKQFYDWAVERKNPIPVFAEMSSVNPVFILPGKLAAETDTLCSMLSKSITLGMGQYCTNPGLIIGLDSPAWDELKTQLATAIAATIPQPMLNSDINKNYHKKLKAVLANNKVEKLSEYTGKVLKGYGLPTLGHVTAQSFIQDHALQEEVFGPFSLMITCKNKRELESVAAAMSGQLTHSIMANEQDMTAYKTLIYSMQEKCGRLLHNAVPTGVQVSLAMQHGGPFPATTDSRFGAVGADNIKRFCRPVAFQNWDASFLPAPLQDKNPQALWRVVNGKPGKK